MGRFGLAWAFAQTLLYTVPYVLLWAGVVPAFDDDPPLSTTFLVATGVGLQLAGWWFATRQFRKRGEELATTADRILRRRQVRDRRNAAATGD